MKIAKARDELKRALEYLEEFNEAADYNKSGCSCFDYMDYDERQKIVQSVPIYLNSWVLPGLRRALEELEK